MISAVILTKDEAENILECIKTLAFCNEIVVVDDNSIDKTTLIAQKMGAKVFKRDMAMDYSTQSNFGMKKAKGEWVLFIDADERASKELALEISNLEKQGFGDYDGYYLKRSDYMWGKWLKHGESASFSSLRLVKKGSGLWKRRVHPYFDIRGSTSSLSKPILHYPHETLRAFIKSINRWSSWHAFANSEEGKRSNLSKIVFLPPAHFIRNFFLRFGFLDGLYGFVFAAIMSFHSFLSWSKLWLLQKGSTKI